MPALCPEWLKYTVAGWLNKWTVFFGEQLRGVRGACVAQRAWRGVAGAARATPTVSSKCARTMWHAQNVLVQKITYGQRVLSNTFVRNLRI